MEEQKQEMSIHRALIELKLIASKLQAKIQAIKVVGVVDKDGKIGTQTRDEFEKSVTANVQSIEDLIRRRSVIKNAIVASNAVTKVTVAGKEMTVADAINRKVEIAVMDEMLKAVKQQFTSTSADYQRKLEQVNTTALNVASNFLNRPVSVKRISCSRCAGCNEAVY